MTNQIFTHITHAPEGFLQPHTLSHLPPDTPVLVAFSGGADSRLLLHLAIRYRDTYGTPVYAAHMNHGIRGDESDRDEAFCREIAATSNIPFFSTHANIPALAAATGESLELAARRVRYDFLFDIMREHHIPLLLTAHHADDQLETLLLRLLRGTGTRGMGGIAPVRPLKDVPGGQMLRPLLSCTKKDILAACDALSLTYVTDSTNASDGCTRNRLRHEVLPVLERIAGEGIPPSAANRLARAAREDDACLSDLAATHAKQCITPEGALRLDKLNVLPPAIARRVIALAYASHAEDATGDRSLQAVHLDNLISLCSKGIHASSVALPASMEARICDGTLVFLVPGDAPTATEASTDPVPLPLGETPWDDGRLIIHLRVVAAPAAPPTDPGLVAWASFPADLPRPLWARRRRHGDVIRRHGVGCKLKKLLCDKRVPPSMRDRLPLICLDSGDTPLWFPTAGFADGYPAPTQGEALLITVCHRQKTVPTA